MIPVAFDYAAATSVDEAIALLQKHGDDAKILAGGHSLLPLMKLRLASPALLVDLGRVKGLSFIEDRGDYIAVGALTTHHMLESSELLRRKIPVLSAAAASIGDMQVRNLGTIGGSLAHADPASDLPVVALALNMEMLVQGPDGVRVVPASDFFLDLWTTTVGPCDVLTEIHVPYPQTNSFQAFEKFRHRAADWAIVGVAVNVQTANGIIQSACIALANVASTPVRSAPAERALIGETVSWETVQRASLRASAYLDPSDDLKATSAYKLHLAEVVTRRALERALELHR